MAYPGNQLGDYELVSPLGAGGMGTVWRARGPSGPVAIKVLHDGRITSTRRRAVFLREVEATARLDHPAIVRIDDVGFAEATTESGPGDATPYMAMELVEGGTLADRKTSLSWNVVRDVLLTLLDALAYAHASGVVHCDIKPSNVLLRERSDGVAPVLTDFGIARARRPTDLTDSSDAQVSAGTPPYMPPEQILGHWRDIGPATDLYALGAMAWELICGRRPFRADNLLALIQNITKQPPPPFEPAFEVPDGVEAWLRQMLAKTPRHRFEFAADAAMALAEMPRQPDLETDVLGHAARETTPTAWKTELVTFADALPDARDTELDTARTLDPSQTPSPYISGAPTIDAPTGAGVGSPSSDDSTIEAPTLDVPLERPCLEAQMRDSRSCDPSEVEAPTLDVPSSDQPTIEAPARDDADARDTQRDDPPGPRPTQPDAPPDATWPRPTMPGTWRAEHARDRERADIHRSLFGLRPVPIVGRTEDRDALWGALGDVVEHGRTGVVLILGDPGLGKSRVAEWLAQRAHALGLAHVLTAVHTSTAGRGTGLVASLGRHFAVDGLDAPQIATRLEEHLGPVRNPATREQALSRIVRTRVSDDHSVLGQMLAAAVGTSESATQNPIERHLVIERTLRRIASTRPVLLRAEDVHWGADALAFVRHLLEADEEQPMAALCVCTATPGRASGVGRRRLEALADHPRTTTLELAPLDTDHWSDLARAILPLEADLARELGEAARGRPSPAVHWVSDGLDRDLLERNPDGTYRLTDRDALAPTLANDREALWLRRIETVCMALANEAVRTGEARDALTGAGASAAQVRRCLWLAAFLGESVHFEEWRDAAARAGLGADAVGLSIAEIRSALGKRRLARPTDEGWEFAGGGLVETLRLDAERSGGATTLHSACAAMLRNRYGGEENDVAARIARHEAAADNHAQAIEMMLRAAQMHLGRTEIDEADAALAAIDRWMAQVDEPDGIWSLERALIEADATITRGDIPTGLDSLTSTIADLEAAGETSSDRDALVRYQSVHMRTLIAHASGAYRAADYAASERSARALLELAREAGERDAEIRALNLVGDALYMRGHRTEAATLYEEARGRLGDVEGEPRARTLLNLAYVRSDQGRSKEAIALANAALEELAAMGKTASAVSVIVLLGGIARGTGDLEASAACYRCAARMHSALGMPSAIPRFNLIEVLLEQKAYATARERLEALLPDIEDRAMLGAAHVALALCSADADIWSSFDAHLAQARTCIEETGVRFPLIGKYARIAGDLAEARGEVRRAAGAWRVALEQMRAVAPDGDDVSYLESKLAFR